MFSSMFKSFPQCNQCCSLLFSHLTVTILLKNVFLWIIHGAQSLKNNSSPILCQTNSSFRCSVKRRNVCKENVAAKTQTLPAGEEAGRKRVAIGRRDVRHKESLFRRDHRSRALRWNSQRGRHRVRRRVAESDTGDEEKKEEERRREVGDTLTEQKEWMCHWVVLLLC